MNIYHLLEHENQLYIYLISKLKKPPPIDMDVGIMDNWIVGQTDQYLLPFGCTDIHLVRQPSPDHKLFTKRDGVKLLDTYEVGKTPKPHWMKEFLDDVSRGVERFLLLGIPSYYTHLVPIKPLSEGAGYVEYLGMKTRKFAPLPPKKHRELVLVAGCFDIVHIGHAHFLFEVYHQYVAGKNRELHVGVADDTSFAYYKKRKPIYAFDERAAILESLTFVTKVHKYAIWKDAPMGTPDFEDGMYHLIKKVNPALFVESRQKPKEKIGALPYLKDMKIPISFVDSIPIHVTDILQKINDEK